MLLHEDIPETLGFFCSKALREGRPSFDTKIFLKNLYLYGYLNTGALEN
jgi:hypothetical protein